MGAAEVAGQAAVTSSSGKRHVCIRLVVLYCTVLLYCVVLQGRYTRCGGRRYQVLGAKVQLKVRRMGWQGGGGPQALCCRLHAVCKLVCMAQHARRCTAWHRIDALSELHAAASSSAGHAGIRSCPPAAGPVQAGWAAGSIRCTVLQQQQQQQYRYWKPRRPPACSHTAPTLALFSGPRPQPSHTHIHSPPPAGGPDVPRTPPPPQHQPHHQSRHPGIPRHPPRP